MGSSEERGSAVAVSLLAVLVLAATVGSIPSSAASRNPVPGQPLSGQDCAICLATPVQFECPSSTNFAADGCIPGDYAYEMEVEGAIPEATLGSLQFLIYYLPCCDPTGGCYASPAHGYTPDLEGGVSLVAPYGSVSAPYGSIVAQSTGNVSVTHGVALDHFDPPENASSILLNIYSLVVVYPAPPSNATGFRWFCYGDPDSYGFDSVLLPPIP